MILNGKELSNKIKEDLKLKISKLDKKPHLVVIQVGNLEASNIYVNSKRKSCEEVRINFTHIKFEENVEENIVIDKINELNVSDVDGILLQLPLPKQLDENKILNMINPNKDVDGLTEVNMGKLFKGNNNFVPCTALGIIELLKYYKIDLNCHAVVIGRSNLVSKPVTQLLLQENATITECHSYTKDLEKYTKQADILIVAAGVKDLIKPNMIKEDAVVIDVGISRVDGKIYGDVEKENLNCSYTPVPGGVGPMTVAMLLCNVYQSYVKNKEI